MLLGTFEKQPVDVKDYDIDYAQWLAQGDGIQSATVDVDLPDLTVRAVFTNPTRVKVWLMGGVPPQKYKITVTVTTDDGRVLQHEFIVKVKDR